MKIFFFTFFLVASGLCTAQIITVHRVEVVGDKVKLFYDLEDPTPSRVYTISIFASKDNFISPLEKVSGDVGLEVKPGGNKVISWSAREELGNDFDGDVAIEIRGRLYVPFIRLDGLQQSFKRGKSHEMTWTGGTQQNILNFDLYKGDEKITSFPNIANVGHYTLTMPLSVKTGNGYRFKITDSKNKDQIVYSREFSISPKIPLLLKIAPVVLLGGVIYALLPDKPVNHGIKDPINIEDVID